MVRVVENPSEERLEAIKREYEFVLGVYYINGEQHDSYVNEEAVDELAYWSGVDDFDYMLEKLWDAFGDAVDLGDTRKLNNILSHAVEFLVVKTKDFSELFFKWVR